MKEIVFATNNRHKLDEIQKIVEGRLCILSLGDINCHEEIEETGTTLEENALIKARFIKEKYGYDCFADDTGLEVDALGGAPGVYSARYAGEGCNPSDNMDKLLAELQGAENRAAQLQGVGNQVVQLQGSGNRAAQFRTVIALLINGEEHLFDGIIKGKIIEEKRGTGGFGYDPIFMPDGYDRTFAELGNEVKNNISHRALAMEKLVGFLTSHFSTS